ncbi:MAG TPA: hypothetical protein PK636_01715, partial [bacterium]|nr:hypothetical protein [bacterium]
ARLHMNSCQEFPDYIKLFIMAIYRLDSYAPPTDIAQYGKRGIDSIAAIVREGIDSGAFREVDPVKATLHLLGALHMQELLVMKRHHDYLTLPAATPEELIGLFLEGIARR